MTQGKLFADKPTAPYQGHSKTSRAAAEAIAPRLGRLQAELMEHFRNSDVGITDEEGIELTKLSPNTYRPRRVELGKLGLIRDSGRTRKLQSGRSGAVWEVVS